MGELTQAARELHPDLAVLAAVTPDRYDRHAAELARLAATVPLGLAGAGASRAPAATIGARLLAGDPVTEAQQAHQWITQGSP